MEDYTGAVAIVWTEGKTDWQHLKRAFRSLRVGSGIVFHESPTDFGDDQLLKQCTALSRVHQPCPTIFIFDRDNEQVLGRVEDPSGTYKAWGNNVYSFAIPIPNHREAESTTCIELYYTDNDLKTTDEFGRRLYLSNEFNPVSGRHIEDPGLSVANKAKLAAGKPTCLRVIDSEVYNQFSQNVALSKQCCSVCRSVQEHDF